MSLLLQLMANGVVNGVAYALMATGFGLVYRSTKIFHIAFAGLLEIAAFSFFAGSAWLRLPLPLALLFGVAVAVLAGCAVEHWLYLPFVRRGASPGVMMVASLGSVVVIQNSLALVFGDQVRTFERGLASPIDIGGITITGLQAIQMIVGALFLAGFAVLTKYWKVFKVLWAMGDNPDLLPVLGIPLEHYRLLIVAISSALGAVPFCLLALDVGVNPYVGMDYFLIAAVAVLIGGLDRYWGWVVAGFLLAALESVVGWKVSTKWTELVEFVVLVLILYVRPQGLFGTRKRVEENRTAPRPLPPLMAASSVRWRLPNLVQRLTRGWSSRNAAIIGSAAAVAFGLAVRPDYCLHLLIMIGIYLLLSYSMNLLLGFGGLLTFCHAAFYGIGAYTFTLLTVGDTAYQGEPRLLFTSAGSYLVALTGAVVFTSIVAAVIGLVALRFRGDFFFLATLGFQMIISLFLYNALSLSRGDFGIYGIPNPRILGWQVSERWEFALLVLLTDVVVLSLLLILYRSAFGMTLKALRDDERAAEGLEICAFRQYLSAFVIAAACAAVAGALMASYFTHIDPTSFGLRESIFLVTLILLGGVGGTIGPLIGSCIVVLLPELLRFLGIPDFIAPNAREIAYGLMLIVLMRYRPQGIAGQFPIR